jgi:hypothetical protein
MSKLKTVENTKIVTKETLVGELVENTNFTFEVLNTFKLEQLVKLKESKKDKVLKPEKIGSNNDIASNVLKELEETEDKKLSIFRVKCVIGDSMVKNTKVWFGLPYKQITDNEEKHQIKVIVGESSEFDMKRYNKYKTRVNARISSHIVHDNKTTTENKTVNKLLAKRIDNKLNCQLSDCGFFVELVELVKTVK